MNPTLHLTLLIGSMVCFAFSAWQSTSPYWNRVVSIGLTIFIASMLSW